MQELTVKEFNEGVAKGRGFEVGHVASVRYFAVFTNPNMADPQWQEFAAELEKGKIVRTFSDFTEIRALLDRLEERHNGN